MVTSSSFSSDQLPEKWIVEHQLDGTVKILPLYDSGCFKYFILVFAVPFGIGTALGYYEFFFDDLSHLRWGENDSGDARPDVYQLIFFTALSGILWFLQIMAWFGQEEWLVGKDIFEERYRLFGYTKTRVLRDACLTVDFTYASDSNPERDKPVGYHLTAHKKDTQYRHIFGRRVFGPASLEEVRNVGIFFSRITGWPMQLADGIDEAEQKSDLNLS